MRRLMTSPASGHGFLMEPRACFLKSPLSRAFSNMGSSNEEKIVEEKLEFDIARRIVQANQIRVFKQALEQNPRDYDSILALLKVLVVNYPRFTILILPMKWKNCG